MLLIRRIYYWWPPSVMHGRDLPKNQVITEESKAKKAERRKILLFEFPDLAVTQKLAPFLGFPNYQSQINPPTTFFPVGLIWVLFLLQVKESWQCFTIESPHHFASYSFTTRLHVQNNDLMLWNSKGKSVMFRFLFFPFSPSLLASFLSPCLYLKKVLSWL